MIRPRAETIVMDYSLAHLADGSLLAELDRLVTHGRSQDARLVACIAEVDARRGYLPQGYPSMFACCVGRLRLSEDAAYKRIQAGRAARKFPALFEAIADGRLHVTAVVKLAPHLTPATVEELMVAATHRSKLELEHLLAERFPQPDLASMLRALPAAGDSGLGCRLVPEPVGSSGACAPDSEGCSPEVDLEPGSSSSGLLPELATPRTTPARVTPQAPERYGLQVTLSKATYELMLRARQLSGEISPRELESFLAKCFAARLAQLERRKLGAAKQPRARRSDGSTRYVPAEARREVWRRDEGQCTFVSDDGHRCEARSGLEFDHVTPVARGGRSTTANLRLRCRAHNHLEAERAYGVEFMRQRREAAASGAASPRAPSRAQPSCSLRASAPVAASSSRLATSRPSTP